MGVAAAQTTGKPVIFIPLHKGADGFLSEEQYEKFYWPTLRKVMLGLIEEGCVPNPAAEGGYDSSLEVVQDLPKGKTLWMIDRSDMARAKETMGQNACLWGNVPSAMLQLGTPQEVRDYVKNLIKVLEKEVVLSWATEPSSIKPSRKTSRPWLTSPTNSGHTDRQRSGIRLRQNG